MALFVVALDQVYDFLEFVQVHLLVLHEMKDEVGVRLAVVLVHDVPDGDAVVLAFADDRLVQEGIGDRTPLQELLFLENPHLFGNGGITRPGLREGIDQFPDAQFALLPEDVHDFLFLRREFLFHFNATFMDPRANITFIFKPRNFFVDFIIENRCSPICYRNNKLVAL